MVLISNGFRITVHVVQFSNGLIKHITENPWNPTCKYHASERPLFRCVWYLDPHCNQTKYLYLISKSLSRLRCAAHRSKIRGRVRCAMCTCMYWSLLGPPDLMTSLTKPLLLNLRSHRSHLKFRRIHFEVQYHYQNPGPRLLDCLSRSLSLLSCWYSSMHARTKSFHDCGPVWSILLCANGATFVTLSNCAATVQKSNSFFTYGCSFCYFCLKPTPPSTKICNLQ